MNNIHSYILDNSESEIAAGAPPPALPAAPPPAPPAAAPSAAPSVPTVPR